MTQYIDKPTLVAEIENVIKNIYAGREYVGVPSWDEREIDGLEKAIKILGTFEVKEVDLEKEIKEEYLKYRCYGGKNNMLVILNEPQFNRIAKHFFELGLKVQKGE